MPEPITEVVASIVHDRRSYRRINFSTSEIELLCLHTVAAQAMCDSAMACLTQLVTISVTAPWLDVPVQLAPLDEIEGRFFFRIAKCCNKTVRLLTGRSIGKSRALSSTTIVEELQKLRNTKYLELCAEAEKKQMSAAEDDLGMDAPDPKRAKKLQSFSSTLPPIIDIDAPTYDHIKGVTLSVVAAGDASAMSVEVTADTIDYLHGVVKIQVGSTSETADGDEGDEDSPERPRGVIWNVSKRAYKVKYMENGKKREKYFKPQTLSDVDKAASVEEAREFLAQRPNDP